MRARGLLLALLLIPAGGLYAADRGATGAQDRALPPPPPPPRNFQPPPAESTDRIPAPEVTITTRGHTHYQEYRIGGRLYMIKVVPAIGPPYYLIDKAGTGRFSRSNIAPGVSPPMWVIKRF